MIIAIKCSRFSEQPGGKGWGGGEGGQRQAGRYDTRNCCEHWHEFWAIRELPERDKSGGDGGGRKDGRMDREPDRQEE